MLSGTYIKGHIDFANGAPVNCQLTGSKLIADQKRHVMLLEKTGLHLLFIVMIANTIHAIPVSDGAK